jgi:hypothetical protein
MLYEFRVVGAIGPAAREALSHLAIESQGSSTVLSGQMDEAGLHDVLDCIRAFGLELMEIRHYPTAATGQPSGAG